MKTQISVKYSRDQIAEMKNFDILSMMDETGVENISLDILACGKCRISGCERIYHLDWRGIK